MSLQRPGIDGTPPGGGHPRGPANGGKVPPGTGLPPSLPEETVKNTPAATLPGVFWERGSASPWDLYGVQQKRKGKTRAGGNGSILPPETFLMGE